MKLIKNRFFAIIGVKVVYGYDSNLMSNPQIIFINNPQNPQVLIFNQSLSLSNFHSIQNPSIQISLQTISFPLIPYPKSILFPPYYQTLYLTMNMNTNQDSDNSILLSKDNKTIELVNELSPKKTSRYKKALFEFFLINHNSWFKVNLTKIRNISAYCGIGIKQLQFQSLVLLSTTKKTSGSYDSAIQGLLNNIRFDLAFINFTNQNTLTYISLSIVFIMALMFTLIYLQLLAKKRLFIKVFIIIFGGLAWTIENYLMIPMVIYSTVYIQHSLFLKDTYVNVYEKDLQFSILIGFMFILQLALLFVIVFMNTIFNYTSGFSYETAYSRAHSMVSLKQITFLFVLSIMHVAVSKAYFLYMNIVVGLVMVYNYVYYLAYYSNFDNLVDSGLWLTLTVSSTLSLINEYTPDGFETVICLIILLPFIYYLLWTGLERSFNRRSNSKCSSPFMYEIKIRRICRNQNNLNEESISQIRALFNEATKQFLEFKLIYIWECNFELKYSLNNELAMMKLLKIIFSNNRPGFLPKPEQTFKNFPDIEAQFLFYKLFKGLSISSNSKDFSLIKYLKHYSKSNLLDLEACNKLIKLIDSNLQSAHLPVNILIKRCIDLHKCLTKNETNLSKYMNNMYDEPAELTRYKSFKEQLFNSGDPNFESQEARQIENYIEKLMDFSLDHRNAKMILSGYPKKLGTIIYVNKHCIRLLSAGSASEILGKNYKSLIPAPFDAAHEFILERFLLFGQTTEVKRDHLVILDNMGFAIEVTMHFKMAFYCHVPYFMLDLIPKNPKECIILFSTQGQIFSYSQELELAISKEVKNIDELFPKLLQQMIEHPLNTIFLYKDENRNEIVKCVQFKIENEVLNILYIFDEEDLHRRKLSGINIYQLFRRKSSLVSKKSVCRTAAMLRRPSINKRKIKKVESTDSLFQGFVYDHSISILKYTKMLKYFNYFSCAFLCIILIAISAAEANLNDTKTLCDIVNDLGVIRNHITGIASVARAIDLYKYEEGLAHSYSYYQNSLNNKTLELEKYLLSLDKYTDVYQIKKKLKNKEIDLVKYINTTTYSQSSNLYQGILDLISCSSQWAQSQFQSTDYLLFIYQNAFHSLFQSMNQTIFESSKSIQEKNSQTYLFFKNLKVLIFIPLLFQFSLSLIIFLFLCKINKTEWKIISDISTSSLLFVRSKTNERIKSITKDHISLNPSIDRLRCISSNIWRPYMISCIILSVLVFIYYFICFYAIDNSLTFFLDLIIDHRYWGGLRRSLVLKVFVWGREYYMRGLPYSYDKSINDLIKFPSLIESFEFCNDELLYIEDKVMHHTVELRSKGYFYTQYLDLLAKHPCDELSEVELCEVSVISQGIHLGIHSFSIDMKSLVKSDHENNSLVLSYLEKTSEDLVVSIKVANEKQEEISYLFYQYYMNMLILTTACFLVIFVLYAKFVQDRVINKIQISLLSMNQLILLFTDSRMGRSQISLEETSQQSFTTTLK